jgi:purine-binding chemotaxis protein CheW
MENQPAEIFCFTIENQQFAIPLTCVDQVLMAVAVSPVPNSSELLHGLIDYHGTLVAVINLRFRLKLPLKPIRISNRFIIANTSKRKIALVADEVYGVIVPEIKDLISADDLDTDLEATGILRRDDGIILIYDIEGFLSNQDEILIYDTIDNTINE